MKPILTETEVADMLGCAVETVEIAAREKRLAAVKYGKQWVFPTQALLDALNAEAAAHVKPPAAAPAPAPDAVSFTMPLPMRKAANAAGSRRRAPPALPPLMAANN